MIFLNSASSAAAQVWCTHTDAEEKQSLEFLFNEHPVIVKDLRHGPTNRPTHGQEGNREVRLPIKYRAQANSITIRGLLRGPLFMDLTDQATILENPARWINQKLFPSVRDVFAHIGLFDSYSHIKV